MIETLGQYKILDRIGAGGLGDVLRARDTRLGRTVAIKVIGPHITADPERRERFIQDARAATKLSHPNIAELYEVGEDQGHLFLACEFVPGEQLTSVIGGRPMNPRRVVDLIGQAADALAEAHADGVTHLDIRPANIMVTPKGNAKILDFGLANWTNGGSERSDAASMVASSEPALGTLAPYLSPEQALGERVDHRTDVFSLGIVMFEMLTGKLPFSGATRSAVALQIVQAPAPAPSSVNRASPVELDPIVGKALAKSLDHRYESAVTMAAEVRSVGAILDVRSDASPPPVVHAAVRQPKRRSGAGWIILLLVLAALAAAAWIERAAIEAFIRRTLGLAPGPVIATLVGAIGPGLVRPRAEQAPPLQQSCEPRAIDVAAGDDDRDTAGAHVHAAAHQRRNAGRTRAFRDEMLVLDEAANRR
jgi:eukaryotic-like serine/threonine-protein kinase